MDLDFLILSTLLLLHYFLHPKAGSTYNPKMAAGSNITREGNGNPLKYSCLENPMDRGAWWATVYGVTQSRTQLKGLSMHVCIGRRKWQPTPVFLPGESQGRGSLVGCHLWGCTESDMTEVTLQHQQYFIYLLFQDSFFF